MTVTMASPPASPRAGTLPVGEAQAIAELQAVVATVARFNALTAAAQDWSPRGRQRVLALLDRVVDVATTSRAGVLVAEERSGAWQDAGDRSFGAWRARTTRAGNRAATAQVRQAQELAAVPRVAEAVIDGRLPLEHAGVIARVAASGTPAQQAAMASPHGQDELLALAEEVDAGAFAGEVSRWAATVDPPALEADHQAQRQQRFLTVSDTPRGAFIKGRLDRMAGHRLTLALEALTPRPATDDDRDPGQRAADALDTMAQAILASADTKPGAHVPPQVSLIMTQDTFAGARAHRDRQRARGGANPGGTAPGVGDARTNRVGRDCPAGGAGGIAADGAADGPATGTSDLDAPIDYPPATLEDGTPVPISELAIVLCECDVTRIAVDAVGVPLDLGRTRRLFSGEQRRAVLARDRECIWPSCHLPARWCHIHHIRWWERDGGPTSVDDGAAICSYHHQETHRRDLTITRHLIPPEAESPDEDRPPSGNRGTGAPPPGRGSADGHCAGTKAPPATPRRRLRNRQLAAVRYEFRDQSGRLLGEPPPPAAPASTGWPMTDAPDPEWTTDPVSGMRIPTLLVPR